MLLAVKSVIRVQCPGVPARAAAGATSPKTTTTQTTAVLRAVMTALRSTVKDPSPQRPRVEAMLTSVPADTGGSAGERCLTAQAGRRARQSAARRRERVGEVPLGDTCV